ncbi:MAG TPA: GyrI-like domain-containing protein, partial [Opitutaceae bacterium]|nr:GyrI-like domain-containing protein [Opitutaceae bacterium]
VFLHAGPYDGLSATYDAIFRDWLPASGESLRDQPAFEVYLNTVDHTPPADLRTEIWVPLQ